MSPSFVIGTAIAAAAIWLAYCFLRAHLARTDAMNALIAWEDEAAMARGANPDETYTTKMPGRHLVDDELLCTREVLSNIQQQMDDLLGQPLHARLRKSWATECKRIEARANKATKELRDAAFWAQFTPGTLGERARFNFVSDDAQSSEK